MAIFKKLFFLFLMIFSFLIIFHHPTTVCADPITSSRCNEFTFDGSGSYDPDNEKISYFWDFGDGQTSTEAIADHTYEKPGDYAVTLTITDNTGQACSSAVSTNTVRANIPPHATFSGPDMICINQPASFDASASYDILRQKLDYKWDFGDGTKDQGDKVVTKTYTKGGKYKIALTIDDNMETVCSAKTVEKTILVNEPPIADAGEKEILKCVSDEKDLVVNFDGSNSRDVNNDELSYTWYFGDGNKSDGVKTSYKYPDVGNYDAKLVVKDNTNIGCGTSVDFVTVRLNRAPKADAGSDIAACPDETIDFDGTNSFVYKKGTVSAKWAFGDGQSVEGLKTMHAYSKPGKYQATLSLDNELNSMCPPSKDTRIITINARPTVDIKAPKSVCSSKEVFFDASSAIDPDGDDLEFYWSFGDGTVLRSGPKVSHIYEQGGDYRVTVIVDDKQGTSCSTATAKVNVKINTPPVADAGPNTVCCVGKEAVFNASASTDPDGDKLFFTWDFGDGTTEKGAVVKHIYKQSGNYTVSLIADDNSGSSCSKSTAGFKAVVNSSPVPVVDIR
ncbi:MAG: PKD domain-containing protein [Candidatus Omnitrophica bacterium]|nr:PKD domain-containing protein [Candidatus Omnitrophota bacterium]